MWGFAVFYWCVGVTLVSSGSYWSILVRTGPITSLYWVTGEWSGFGRWGLNWLSWDFAGSYWCGGVIVVCSGL